MSGWKKILWSIVISFSCAFIAIISFLWWNHYPPLPLESEPPVLQISPITNYPPPSNIKAVSYNIHFGVGIDWKQNIRRDKIGFYQRLDQLVNVLKEINADIVLLQEVDFNSNRSCSIDQATYIAKKAGYSYIAKATNLKEKFHPSLYGMHGHIDHGICVLSRFPIKHNHVKVFNHPKEVPFYLRWVYSPHGAQKVDIEIGDKTIHVINVHLEPWAQKTREQEVKKVVEWIDQLKGPVILGGDFNAIPPETPKKMNYHMNDAPWFIDLKKWDIENDQTIQMIRKLKGFTEAISIFSYLQNEQAAFTYPSNSPVEKIDYLFTGKGLKVLYGFVYHYAQTASDHLPIVALIRYLQKSHHLSSDDTSHHQKVKEPITIL